MVLSSTAPRVPALTPLAQEASTRLLDTEPRAQERSWASSVTSVALGWGLWGSVGDRGGCWCVEQFPPAQERGAAWGGGPPSWRLQAAICASMRGSVLQRAFLFHFLQFAFALAESRRPLHRNTQREREIWTWRSRGHDFLSHRLQRSVWGHSGGLLCRRVATARGCVLRPPTQSVEPLTDLWSLHLSASLRSAGQPGDVISHPILSTLAF